jgi:hypothetical protein
MNTNSVESINQAVKTISALTEQIQTWPLSVVLVICLLIAGSTMKLTLNVIRNAGHALESTGLPKTGKITRIVATCLIQLIPVFVLASGGWANGLIADPGKVAPCPNPQFVIVMWGVCIGAMTWIIHWKFVKRFEKFLPLLSGQPTNGSSQDHPTVERKDDDPPTPGK